MTDMKGETQQLATNLKHALEWLKTDLKQGQTQHWINKATQWLITDLKQALEWLITDLNWSRL